MNKIKCGLCAFLCIFCISSAFAFSAQDIISPSAGVWKNLQALVLDTSDGSELYYSLSGSDPLLQGFAYDGKPIVIQESGSVRVRITAVSKDGTRSDFTIDYTVDNEPYTARSAEEKDFVSQIMQNPIRKYVSGTTFSIPSDFTYSMSNSRPPILKGEKITLSKDNSLERYIPCTVSDGKSAWHFVLHTSSAQTKTQNERDVPFYLQNWETFLYKDSRFIYQIDDSYWSASKEAIHLDRTVPHTVRWQNIDFKKGNPIYEIIIPPKPRLVSDVIKEGEEIFVSVFEESHAEKPYLLGKAQNASSLGTISSGIFFKKVGVDTFKGDVINGILSLGVYFDSVYQGDLQIAVNVDKQAPLPPTITSTAEKSFARSTVAVNISAEHESSIFYAVSKPSESFEKTETFEEKDFVRYLGVPIVLRSASDSAAFYTISAFAVDASGNKSEKSTYQIIVDEYNYYFDAKNDSSQTENQDGSYTNPFTDFASAVKALNSNFYSRLHFLSDAMIPNGEYEISSDCQIVGNGHKIIFEPNANLFVNNGADVEIKNVLFEKKNARSSIITVRDSEVIFSDCELSAHFTESGTVLTVEKSSLELNNTGLTSQATSYASCLYALDSICTIKGARLTANADSSVLCSIEKGMAIFSDSKWNNLSRNALSLELNESTISLIRNEFIFPDVKSDLVQYLWKDVDTIISEEIGTTVRNR